MKWKNIMMHKYFKEFTTKDLIQEIIGKNVHVISDMCITCNLCDAIFYSIPIFNVDNLRHLKKLHFNNCKSRKPFTFTKSEQYFRLRPNVEAIAAREAFDQIPSCSYKTHRTKKLRKNKASSRGKK
jgi:hypothetical protein